MISIIFIHLLLDLKIIGLWVLWMINLTIICLIYVEFIFIWNWLES